MATIRKRKEALALQPIIGEIRLSLERFQAVHEAGGDYVSAFLDLKMHVEDLDDAIDKNESAAEGGT